MKRLITGGFGSLRGSVSPLLAGGLLVSAAAFAAVTLHSTPGSAPRVSVPQTAAPAQTKPYHSEGFGTSSAHALPPSHALVVRTMLEQEGGAAHMAELLDQDPSLSAPDLSFTTGTSAQECSNCHADKYLEWAESEGTDIPLLNVWDSDDEAAYSSGNLDALDPYNTQSLGNQHSLGWKGYYFQLIYHEQPSAVKNICNRCHVAKNATKAVTRMGVYAPLANSTSAPNSTEGITCVTCHLDSSGKIVASESAGGPHGVTANEQFYNGYGVCLACHNSTVYGSFTETGAEFLDQVTDGSTCVGCHMTGTDGSDAFHGFPGGQSNAYRSKALNVSIPTSLSGSSHFAVQLSNQSAGHNVPTGDTFRAFSLVMKVTNSAGQLVLSKETFITPQIKTPVFSEQVNYERIDPIGYQSTATIDYGTLGAGTYSVNATLRYYQIKPATLAYTDGTTSTVEPYNQYDVKSWSQSLSISN